MNLPETQHASMKLNRTDQASFNAVRQHLQQSLGMRLSVADVFRLGLRALAQQHNIKGAK